ncbi:MAG: hypothetical protein U0414_34915 [Polyangiaceae bacterium]
MRALAALLLAFTLAGCHLILGDEYSFVASTTGTGGGTTSSSESVGSTTGAGMSCLPTPPMSGCGDAVCDDSANPAETCANCPVDCGVCCVAGTGCNNNQCKVGNTCCTPPAATFTGQPYGGMGYANFTFGVSGISSIAQRVCFNNDPGRASGMYYQLYDFPIDGIGQYFGLQTDASGARAIFSRFGTMDLANVRKGEGAVSLASDAEGPFVSVRLDVPLGVGCFDVTVTRAEASGSADWFDMRVKRACDATEVYVGGILFPRAVAAVPASFEDGGGSWLEVYSMEKSVFDIPFVDFDVTPKANGSVAPSQIVSSYAERPNVDVDLTTLGTARFRAGLKTPRCHPAATVNNP